MGGHFDPFCIDIYQRALLETGSNSNRLHLLWFQVGGTERERESGKRQDCQGRRPHALIRREVEEVEKVLVRY